MKEVSLNDVLIFFLGALIVISLAFFTGEVDKHVAGQLSQVSAVSTPTDFDLFKICFGRTGPATNICIRADFNGDGYVNIGDFNLFLEVPQYDINNDNKVEWTFSLTSVANSGGDFNYLLSCLTSSQAVASTSSECAKADFNGDGVIDVHDYMELVAVQIYDLDSDKKVTYTSSEPDISDQDDDGVPDNLDNCISTPNASQSDRGSVGLNSAPDGIGDACQCGDVNGDGVASGLDGSMILQSLLVPPTVTLTNPDLCDVGGSIGCTSADAAIIQRASLNIPTATITQQCVGVVDTTGPTINIESGGMSQNIAIGLPNQLFGEFIVDASESIYAIGTAGGQSMRFSVDIKSNLGQITDLQDISLYDESGVLLAGPVPAANLVQGTQFNTQGVIPFYQTIRFSEGRHSYYLKGRIGGNGFQNGDTLGVYTEPSTQWQNVTSVHTGEAATITSGTVVMRTMTVKADTSQSISVDLKMDGLDGPITTFSGYALFSWNSANTDYCTASGDTFWSGAKSTSGSETIWVGNEKTGETTYTITCGVSSGKVDSTSDSITVSFKSRPSITVTRPNGSESFTAGQTIPVTWTSANTGTIPIGIRLLKDDGTRTNIVPYTTNTGNYNLTIPANLVGGLYKVEVFTFDKGPSANDYSDDFFIITAAGTGSSGGGSPGGK